jgi:hypothetical protein
MSFWKREYTRSANACNFTESDINSSIKEEAPDKSVAKMFPGAEEPIGKYDGITTFCGLVGSDKLLDIVFSTCIKVIFAL